MRTIDDFVVDKGSHWELTTDSLKTWYNECIAPEEEPRHTFDRWLNTGTPPLNNILQSMQRGVIKYKGKPFVIK